MQGLLGAHILQDRPGGWGVGLGAYGLRLTAYGVRLTGKLAPALQQPLPKLVLGFPDALQDAAVAILDEKGEGHRSDEDANSEFQPFGHRGCLVRRIVAAAYVFRESQLVRMTRQLRDRG